MSDAKRQKLQAIESVFRNAARKANVNINPSGTVRAEFPNDSDRVNVAFPLHVRDRKFNLVFWVNPDNSVLAANAKDVIAVPSHLFDGGTEDAIANAIKAAVAEKEA